MITGAHSVINSKNPEADRAFLRDVLKLTHVDVGHGWLIFGLPPSEIAVHPAEKGGAYEFFLMCEDIDAFAAEMTRHGLACSAVREQPWGRVSRLTLPGGGSLDVYQPKHARPAPMPEK